MGIRGLARVLCEFYDEDDDDHVILDILIFNFVDL